MYEMWENFSLIVLIIHQDCILGGNAMNVTNAEKICCNLILKIKLMRQFTRECSDVHTFANDSPMKTSGNSQRLKIL